jgi:hypothetical protein
MKFVLIGLAVLAAVALWSSVYARNRAVPRPAAVTMSAPAGTAGTNAAKKAPKAPRPKAPIYAY